jgi:N-sulfoglucosamine sulfohydrolase
VNFVFYTTREWYVHSLIKFFQAKNITTMKKVLLMIITVVVFNINICAQEFKPNFIIIIADDISWDDFGCYGNAQVKTPNIDHLAENGIRFNNTYLTASSCSPSRNSILTGRYPHNTGAAELHTQPPVEMLSFPEFLRQGGYYSAMSGKFHMGDYANRGFDDKITDLDLVGNGGQEMWVSQLKSRPKDQPFFMWFAAYDAHRPWGPNQFSGTHHPDSVVPPVYFADRPGTRADLAAYYDEVFRFDHYVGEVVKELESQGVLQNTLIIVMSDNGRAFPHSKTRVNDRGMKTPFVVYWPKKITTSAISESLISVIDIAPTILSLAGLQIHEQFQGQSFEKVLDKPETPFRNYVFAEHNWHDYEAHQRMVRDKDYMYILNSRPNLSQTGPADALEGQTYADLFVLKQKGKLTAIQSDIFVTPRPFEELYSYELDPEQFINLASHPEYQVKLEHLRGILQKWMEETGDNVPTNITRDWYMKEPGYKRTPYHEIRGEMPGEKRNATQINNKGPF